MGWLDNLKAKIGGDFELRVAGRKAARGKTPRDTLLQSIDDSIAFHQDPSFRVASGRRKNKEPNLVYRLDGNQAAISLRYSRVRLKLDGKSDELSVDKSKLSDALAGLREGVAAGEFDDQLNKIKADRVAAANASKAKRAR
jgi:hypothetical protein